MNRKQRAVLSAILAHPTRADIRWGDIEGLILSLGARKTEGSGSRVRFVLHGARATFHRPHPRPHAGKATVEDVRAFLRAAGVAP